ncbi:ribosome-associated ATPase/putative transporter RbbA [Otariodibacter sp.]|uniref:ribosome-associated ATPase/putative transporter RbbA n=1 Tax=Otariodibacter sp. TaxID=3030919 RepID=UPI0026085857|nr:ribosome-associated ATPase/putative transporter RbbA [Otariodibacter sp.]
MTKENVAILIKNLSHNYGKIQALTDISLKIPVGSSVGLIGADGVGKSTLLSLIAGVKILQSGEILVFDSDIKTLGKRTELFQRLAFMPQGLGKNLYPTLSIYENIDFHARMFGLNKSQRQTRIKRLLGATGLLPFAERAAGKLSGGMKQKLSLCCALVHNPDLLLLDEPTTGVDPLSRRQFWQLIQELRSETPNMTIIVATAYIDEAENFEYALAMDDGKVLTFEPTKKLIQRSNSKNLEQAYIKLLPEDKKGAVDGLSIPLYQKDPNEEPAIIATDLTKKFGDFVAVDNVSFIIPKGEIFGFLGSNGCGKSTTMKMLTGLLEPTEGKAIVLGQPVEADDIENKKRVGYMSQSFSLYEELTVKQNLELHAKLYQIPKEQWEEYVNQAMQQFDLLNIADITPISLPLGIRQRLQLAAACLHKPELLILDEPTSGVDPAARDMFWEYLIKLSREDKITIFVTTHFMNEAERCDRISFMHSGKVLAIDTPKALQKIKNANSLEDAFIMYLEEQVDDVTLPKSSDSNFAIQENLKPANYFFTPLISWFAMIWTFALREGKELLRDKVRLFFAIGGPTIMLLAMSASISFDITPLKFTVLDRDNTSESHHFIEYFSGSPYFLLQPQLTDANQISTVLQSSEIKLVIDIPDNFGKDLLSTKKPKIGIFIDGAFPATAENLKASTLGVITQYIKEFYYKQGFTIPDNDPIETRFIYNQNFKSVVAMTPGVIMLAMMLIPSMMTALGVVREKEIGSIMNLYGSPASGLQFLLGKQLPYVALSFLSYLFTVWITIVVFDVPIKGSVLAMFFGAILVILASTSFGLLISSFVKSQVAALFATSVIMIVPSMNFSGMIYPTATLPMDIYLFAHAFPGAWFQIISLGGFTKGLGFMQFIPHYIALIVIYLCYLMLANIFLKKQEK